MSIWLMRRRRYVKLGLVLAVCFLLGSASAFADQVRAPLVINYTSGTDQYRLAVQGDCAWIGTEGGLVLTKGDTGQRLKFTPADWRGAPGARSVVIDTSGSMWACPSGSYGRFDPGLFQFDGLEWEWKERALQGAMYGGLVVAHIASDDTGNAWVLLRGGRMIRFRGSDWYSWEIPGTWWVDSWSCVAGKGGKGWAALGGGRLFTFEGTDLSWVTLEESIIDIGADLRSGVWLAATGRLLYFAEGRFETFELPPESGLSDTGFYLRVDGRNTKWCIKNWLYRLGVASLSQDETWGVYGDLPVPVEYVQDVRFGEDGCVWLMADTTIRNDPLGIGPPQLEPSLLRYGAGGSQTFWGSEPLPASSVSDLCIDSGQAVWVAGDWEDYAHDDPYASYLCRWDRVKYETFWPWHRELPNKINSIAPTPDGDVWFGTDEGLYVFDGEEWRQVNDASITKVKIAPDGQVWIIWSVSQYERRAQRFDGTRWWSAYRPDWSAQELSDVAFDSNGVAWFSCDDRFWDQYEDSTPRNYA
ncbi:MAG TPA: two-component regulator propeller domain-containing protein, partial [bacterium]|nr:two-component regulator propeller domain-containing protein [bacterium]